MSRAKAATEGSLNVQITSIVGGQAGPCDAFRNHACIAKNRCAVQQSVAARRCGIFGKRQILNHINHAASMGDAHGEFFKIGRNAAEIGFGTNDGEGAIIDRLTVANIVKH